MTPECLHADLEGFTNHLQNTLDQGGVTWWHRGVTFQRKHTLTSLSQALAACESTPWTAWAQVRRVARAWRKVVATLVDSWFQLLEKATELWDTCRDTVTGEATTMREEAEAALEMLEQVVAACDKATAFPQELRRRVRDIEAALKGTKEPSCDFRVTLAAKVAEAGRLWDASVWRNGYVTGATFWTKNWEDAANLGPCTCKTLCP